jgi:DNA-binding CsgD family transcriptional regulator
MLDLLEDLSFPAALIDADGRVIDVTRQADPIDGLPNWGIGKRLQLDSHSASNRLWDRLAELLRRDSNDSRLLLVTGNDGRRIAIKFVPLRTLLPFVPTARVALLILDIDSKPELPQGILRSMFRLTPAEARLTRTLMKTCDLEEASRALGVSVGTSRQQLKSVFHKTNTTRQSELLFLLGRIAVLGDFASVDRIE